jgi:hypothetical protein
MLPDDGGYRRTPQSLPLRERVLLAQRISVARVAGISWAEIATIENMRERTLRHFHRRWYEDLAREGRTPDALLRVVMKRVREQRTSSGASANV